MSAHAPLAPLPSMREATCIIERFHSVADRGADRTAVVCGAQRVTYAELERRARLLSDRLRSRGVGPESPVGLCVERSVEMIVAILAILGAGGAYVPLDPAYPAERLRYLVNDARPALILHDRSCASLISEVFARSGASCLLLEDCAAREAPAHGESARAKLWPDNLAYIIYTSGSTGGPKGSLVTHGNVLRLFAETEAAFAFGDEDVWPLLHSYAFDFSVWEIFGALLYGGTLVIPTSDEVSDPGRLLPFLVRHGVTVLNQTPSFFHRFCQFLEKVPQRERAGLRPSFIVFGGERLNFAALRRWFDTMGDDTVLVNMYGITETTVHVTLYPVSRADAEQEQASVIGAPIADLKMYLLDEHLRPVPPGATGEIFVEGPGVTRGYHDRPRLTAEIFLPCPFAEGPGRRMYRTGDLARVDGEGRLVYLGRKGGFVKVRGFRVSLAEVEAALRSCDGVENAVVLTRDHEGSSELDAWLVCAKATLTASSLRRRLSEKVPAFAVPHRFFRIDALPLTQNGKIDAIKLRLSGVRVVDDRSDEATASEAESRMLAVWKQAMGQGSITITDDFFASGGDSIRAVELVVALRRAGYPATVQDVLQAPTVRDLLRRIGPASTESAADPAAAGGDSAAASDMQAIMLDRYARHARAGNGVYHTQQSFTLLDRELDVGLLRRCVELACARDISFRTKFIAAGAGFMRRHEAEPLVEIRQVDLSALDVEAQRARIALHEEEDLRSTFEPTSGTSPLTRIALLQLSATSVRVFVSAHHAVDDGWGRQRFLMRVFDAYRKRRPLELPALRDPYDAYVARQMKKLSDPEAQRYWERYAIAEECLLPVERPAPALIHEYRSRLRTATALRVLESARHAKIQAKAIFVAAVLEAIAETQGAEVVTLGLVVNGRFPELPETMDANGLYWNMHPFTWHDAASATESVRQIHERLMQQDRYALFPLSAILAKRSPGKEFRFTFNYTSFPAIGGQGGLELRDFRGLDLFHYPVNVGLDLDVEAEEAELRINCDSTLCSPDVARRLLEAIERKIERASEGRQSSNQGGEGAAMPLSRRDALASYDLSLSMVEIMKGHAALRPEKPAVVCGGRSLSYEELDVATDRLARVLLSRGVGVEHRVGLSAENSIEMIVGMFGILKAGAAYVPLDPADPRERLTRLVADSGIRVLLTQQHLLGRLPEEGIERVVIDSAVASADSAGLDMLAEGALPPQRLAYLIYTSGSTGAPKAVQITWANLLNHVYSFCELSGISSEDCCMLFSSFAFDGSVEEIFAPLLMGGTLIIHPEQPVPLAALTSLIVEHRLTTLDFTVGYWSVWVAFLAAQRERIPGTLRRVVIGGELIRATQLAEWDAITAGQAIDLFITYGPTEATVISTGMLYRPRGAQAGIERQDGFIGRPLANISLYLLDAELNPVPKGSLGEIFIAGAGLARGYLGAAAVTAEKFIPNPHGSHPGDRMYRTGDLGCLLDDGVLQFRGRTDNQIKIRGFRVELGEIESSLCLYPGVQSAVAVATTAPDGNKLLGAFVLEAGGHSVEPRALERFVRARLPEFMVPSRIDVMRSFPVKSNGKTDTAALLEMLATRGAGDEARKAAAPSDQADPRVAEMVGLFASVLGRESIGAEENFFKSGGHSLLVLQLLSRLRISHGVNVQMKDFFRFPTPAGLAHLVSRSAAGASAPPSIARLQRLTTSTSTSTSMAAEGQRAESSAKGGQ